MAHEVDYGELQAEVPGKQATHEVPERTKFALQVKATVVEEQVAALGGHKTQTPEISEYPVEQAVATVADEQVVAPVGH